MAECEVENSAVKLESVIIVEKWTRLRIFGGYANDDSFAEHLLSLEESQVFLDASEYNSSTNYIKKEDGDLDGSSVPNILLESNDLRAIDADLTSKDVHNSARAVSEERRHSSDKVVTQDERRYQCRICGDSFLYNSMLHDHYKFRHNQENHKPDNPVACEICHKVFRGPSSLMVHKNKVCLKADIPDDYVCTVCGKELQSRMTYKAHMAAFHSQDKPVECEICHERFKIRRHLNQHHQEKHLGIEHVCETCGARYKRRQKLLEHERDKHGKEVPTWSKKKTYPCNVCDKVFTKNQSLQNHLRLHTGNKFNCDICGDGFLSKSYVKRHKQNIHGIVIEEDKPLKCEFCHKGFTTEPSLQAHRNSAHLVRDAVPLKEASLQEGEDMVWPEEIPKLEDSVIKKRLKAKQYRCDMADCGERFQYQSLLRAHKDKHMGIEFLCELCGIKYKSRSKLLQHEIKKHGRPLSRRGGRRRHGPDPVYECVICDKRFSQKANLTDHNRMHTGDVIVCDLCGKGFLTQRSMVEHRIIHAGTKQFKCDMCETRFNRQRDLLRHKNQIHLGKPREKKVACELCGKTFFSNSYLREHMNTHTGERPFPCSYCDKAFFRKVDVRAHIRFVHLKEQSYYQKRKKQKEYKKEGPAPIPEMSLPMSIPVNMQHNNMEYHRLAMHEQHQHMQGLNSTHLAPNPSRMLS